MGLRHLSGVKVIVIQRSYWVDGDNFDVGILLFQVFTNPRKRTPGACSRDENVDVARDCRWSLRQRSSALCSDCDIAKIKIHLGAE